MTRKSNAAATRDTISYQQHLKTALKFYHDAQRLGTESLLATPYFLGRALSTQQTAALSAGRRGKILQAELLAAARTFLSGPPPRNRTEMETLLEQVRQDPDAPAYAYLVLELRCFQRFFNVVKTTDIWESEHLLPGSRAEHYRDYDRAVALLGDALLDRLRPGIRLESPVVPIKQVGYEAEFTQALKALKQGQSVTLCGAGGVGKTTLGANLAATDDFSAVMWYTFRSGLNDNLHSLLFALAHFLHEQGASTLWRQLAVGQLDDLNLVMGLLRKDIQQVNAQPPLLCFDEGEVLLPTGSTNEQATHQEILEFLRTLHGQLPILYMSQVPLFETDCYCELRGLKSVQLTLLLEKSEHHFSAAELQDLHGYTGGNPRLVRLALLLLQPGQSIADLVATLPHTPGVQPVLQRLWQRLAEDERRILQQLAVFRNVAPADHWQEDAESLPHLIDRGLVQQDGYGGIEVLPILRDILYAQLDSPVCQFLHLEAAEICASRGSYTEAAYHYAQSKHATQAVQIWYPHRQQEILRGQSGAAHTIFAQIVPSDLAKTEQKALKLILAELHQRYGAPQQGLAALADHEWTEHDEADIQAHNLRGQFLEALGRQEEADRSYTIGIQTLMRLQQNLVHLQCQRGLLHTRQRNTTFMRQHLLHARCETHRLQGMIEEFEGRFTDAHISYQSALALAENINDHSSIANIQFALVRILSRLGKYEQSLQAAQDAMIHCEASSDWFTLAQIQANLAGIHRDACQYERAIEAGRQALSQFRLMNAPHWIGLTAVNLAETYADQQEWKNAARYAEEAIEQKAPHSYPYGLFTLGRVRRAEGVIDEAKELFQRSLHAAQENEDRFMEAYAQRVLGEIEWEKGHAEAGHRYIEQALWLFEQVGTKEEIDTTAALLTRADERERV